ncbi:MAG: AmmeMemoRadiSam system radical SAM enzyme, partial [Sedimentisphaerales bacterium]|nr:AmmeMemoRadiSam system radical SAM enzyme [Sedimentisphaerales bacterium]
QAEPQDSTATSCPPEKVVRLAKETACPSIAYTYTEPIVYYEYTIDSSRLARQAGIRNVLVTAAYVNPDPWQQLLSWTDAANIDLKFMSDQMYAEICSGRLGPVLDAIVAAKKANVWVEITNLVIPTLNDLPAAFRELAKWVKANCGPETPLHFSGFWPRYKLQHLPPTPAATLETARQIALAEGLWFVYMGNVISPSGQTTFCPGCGRALIERSGFAVIANRLDNGRCPGCGRDIPGVWT